MPHEPNQVIEAVNRHWSLNRRKRLLHPTVNGRGSRSWADEMRNQVKAIEKVLREHFAAPPDKRAELATLRKHRGSIQVAIREASHWPYKKALPLFVSEWFVTSILEPDRLQQFVKEERDYTGEHIIPLNSTVSGTRLLASPGRYMPQVARAMTTPMCEVVGYEDRRILRLHNLTPDLPFQRYGKPYRGEPIMVYKTIDGKKIESSDYNWKSWRGDMQLVPLYQEGLQFSEHFAEHWAEMLDPELVRRMTDLKASQNEPAEGDEAAEQQEGDPATQKMIVGARGEELDEIEAKLLRILDAADVPMTHRGFPRLRIPVRCSRVSVVFRGEDGQDLFTLIIGPERRKLDLYHCSGHGGAHVREGGQMMSRILAVLPRLSPNILLDPLPRAYPKGSSGCRILYDAKPTVDATVELARRCIEVMLHVCRNEDSPLERGL